MSRDEDITGRGGARPGAGRPKGAKDTAPRKPLARLGLISARVHDHVEELIQADAQERGVTVNALVGELLEKRYRCRCERCQEARREIRRRRREART